MKLPIQFFPTTSEPACEPDVCSCCGKHNPGHKPWVDAFSAMIERERLRQRGLLELALEALGRGDEKTVETCVNRISHENQS